MSLCDLLERAAAGLRAAQGDQAGEQPGDPDDGEPEEERGAGHQRGQQEGAHRPAQVPAAVSQGEPASPQAGREVLGGEGVGHLQVVQWLVLNAASLQPQSNLCKRVLEQRISARTGGYCQARQKLPTLVVTSVTDHLFEQLQAQMREELPDVPRPMFVIDGTTLRLPHERELVSAFPPGHNQHGDNHWPTMLLVAFHDVHSGLATRPSWGAMYGPGAVGEQELGRQALERLPTEAIVLADGNFGIFAFAYAVRQTQRPLLLRLTAARARKVLGGARLHCGRRRKVVWEASVWERKTHPDLPAGALVEGWVVACRHPARPGEILYFFTTLDL